LIYHKHFAYFLDKTQQKVEYFDIFPKNKGYP